MPIADAKSSGFFNRKGRDKNPDLFEQREQESREHDSFRDSKRTMDSFERMLRTTERKLNQESRSNSRQPVAQSYYQAVNRNNRLILSFAEMVNVSEKANLAQIKNLRELLDEKLKEIAKLSGKVGGKGLIGSIIDKLTDTVEDVITKKAATTGAKKAAGGLVKKTAGTIAKVLGKSAAAAAGAVAGGGILSKILPKITMSEGLSTVLGGLIKGKGSSIGVGLDALQTMKSDANNGNHLRTWLRSIFGIEDPGEDAPWIQREKGTAKDGDGGPSFSEQAKGFLQGAIKKVTEGFTDWFTGPDNIIQKAFDSIKQKVLQTFDAESIVTSVLDRLKSLMKFYTKPVEWAKELWNKIRNGGSSESEAAPNQSSTAPGTSSKGSGGSSSSSGGIPSDTSGGQSSSPDFGSNTIGVPSTAPRAPMPSGTSAPMINPVTGDYIGGVGGNTKTFKSSISSSAPKQQNMGGEGIDAIPSTSNQSLAPQTFGGEGSQPVSAPNAAPNSIRPNKPATPEVSTPSYDPMGNATGIPATPASFSRSTPGQATPTVPSTAPGVAPVGDGSAKSAAIAEERAKVFEHIDNNPQLKQKLFAVASNEQGMNSKGVQAVMEETVNRAIVRGGGVEGGIKRLEKETRFTTEGGYYEDTRGSASRAMGRASDPNNQAFFNNAYEKVRAGSDVSNNAYGNASSTTAQNKITGANGISATPTQRINGETFFGPNSDEPGYIKNYDNRNQRLEKRAKEIEAERASQQQQQQQQQNPTVQPAQPTTPGPQTSIEQPKDSYTAADATEPRTQETGSGGEDQSQMKTANSQGENSSVEPEVHMSEIPTQSNNDGGMSLLNSTYA